MADPGRVAKFGHDGCREVERHERGYLVALPVPKTWLEQLATEAIYDFEYRSRVEPFWRPQLREWSPRT